MPAYRMLRGKLDRSAKDQWNEWMVARVDAMAADGLPEGWSWSKGERTLSAAKLSVLVDWLKQLPKGVVAVESTAIHLTLYWREPEHAGALDELGEKANQLLTEMI